jgi:hypothetical protein
MSEESKLPEMTLQEDEVTIDKMIGTAGLSFFALLKQIKPMMKGIGAGGINRAFKNAMLNGFVDKNVTLFTEQEKQVAAMMIKLFDLKTVMVAGLVEKTNKEKEEGDKKDGEQKPE